jgi:hypothetical protein
MLYPNIEEIMKIIVEEGENRFTSGNPKTWTPYLKRKNGITVALKQQNAFDALCDSCKRS